MTDSQADKPSQGRPGEKRRQSSRQPLASAELFQGQQQALIEHDGEIYRLVLTRNNKLLLQK